MKQPVALSQPDPTQELSIPVATRKPRRSSAAGGLARRPRSPVAGGKALARINFFKVQRGVPPEARPRSAGARTPGEVVDSPAEKLATGFHESRAKMAAPAPAAPAAQVPQTWQPLGPYYMPHGQTYGQGTGSRPPVAGRISTIAIDPADATHILCGAAGGGVWESRDSGSTWLPRTDDQPSLAIGSLAFDPSAPLRVFAGTGEGNIGAPGTTNLRAAGFLASTDGGTTWASVPATPFVGASFFDLLVDSADGGHILAATTNGIYETSDGGATWARRRNAMTWCLSKHAVVPTNPANGNEIFAASTDGLFRSNNAGTTWSSVALSGAPAGGTLVRMSVSHSPSNGSIAYVFAAYDTGAGDPAPRLWRRATFGGGFTAISPPAGLETGQAWYDWFLAVAPNNPDLIYLGAINVHRGIRQASGSWTWLNVSAKTPTGDSIHPDQHALAFSPADPNVMYVGNDGGIYRSPDAGTTWESLNRGLCITEIEFLAHHPEYDAWILAGTQDNGTIRYEGQQTWYQIQDGDGGDCGVDEGTPATCYHSFYGPYVEKSTQGGGWNTWAPTVPAALANEQSLFYPPLEVNGELVVRGATSIWISRNGGSTWTPKSLPGLTGYPSALAAPTQDRIYVGTARGELYRLDRTGSTWNVTALAAPSPGGFVSDLLSDVDLWATVNSGGSGRVYRSADDGITWTDCSTGIPTTVALHAIEIDRSNPNTLFVGCDVGVYLTTDGGASWTPLARGLPNVLVKDVLLHQKTGLLRIGTQARGVWELSVKSVTMPDVAIYLRDHAADTGRGLLSADNVPNPFQPGSNLFWWQSPDIKIDASPFRVATLDDLDFAIYSDDRSKEDSGIEFASGLFDERPMRGQTVRAYVQVHNRGSRTATNVAVRVFVTSAALTFPDLPSGFWTNFPNNMLPAISPWQPLSNHRVIASIDSGRSAVVGFDWSVPLVAVSSVGLIAVVSADNDAIQETELAVVDLVRKSRNCALRNYAVVNPPPLAGPIAPGIALDLWTAQGAQTLSFDKGGVSLVRGLIVDKTLVASAKKAGWKPVKLTAADAEFLAQLTDRRPELKKQLRLGQAWRPPARTPTLLLGDHPAGTVRPIVVLFNLKSKFRTGSAIVASDEGKSRGGLTFINLATQGIASV